MTAKLFKILLDVRAQPVIIAKNVAQKLGLQVVELKPCPHSILTSIGRKEFVTNQTKATLLLIFNIGNGLIMGMHKLKWARVLKILASSSFRGWFANGDFTTKLLHLVTFLRMSPLGVSAFVRF